MKKRFLSGLLCLCLLSGAFVINAFADNVTVDNITQENTDQHYYFDFADGAFHSLDNDVLVSLADSTATESVDAYKVEILWGDMQFAWGATEAVTKTWDPATHEYTDNSETRADGWWLVNDGTPLALAADAPTGYDTVLAQTSQNYVVLFNHSSQPVDANIAIAEVNAGTDDDNITAALAKAAFGVAATDNATSGYDYSLSVDPAVNDPAQAPVFYSFDNSTAAAASVTLSGTPTDGALNADDYTTVAKVTVTLKLPSTETTPATP